jgi:hypothetical protein
VRSGSGERGSLLRVVMVGDKGFWNKEKEVGGRGRCCLLRLPRSCWLADVRAKSGGDDGDKVSSTVVVTKPRRMLLFRLD